jgi:hypothetical protein
MLKRRNRIDNRINLTTSTECELKNLGETETDDVEELGLA